MAGLNEMSVIYQYINDSFFIPVFVLCGGGGLFCLLFVMFVMLGHNNRIKHFNYIKRPDGQSASKINVTELHCG